MKEGAGQRLLLAMQMQREGAELMKQKLRRRYPDASRVEIDALFMEWLLDRPADAPGTLIEWPSRKRSRRRSED